MMYNNLIKKAREKKQNDEELLKDLATTLTKDNTMFQNYSLSYISKRDRRLLAKNEQIDRIISIMKKDINDVYLNELAELDEISRFNTINNFDITVYENVATLLIEGSRFRAKKIVKGTHTVPKVLNQSKAIKKLLCDFKENSEYINEPDDTIFKCKMRKNVIPTFSLYANEFDVIKCFKLLGFTCDTRVSNGITYHSFNREVKR